MTLSQEGQLLSATISPEHRTNTSPRNPGPQSFQKFLHPLNKLETLLVTSIGKPVAFRKGEVVFRQGRMHSGIYIIMRGGVRTYFCSKGGREITLAYWGAGDFVGTPELFGRGTHLWSGVATENTDTYYLTGEQLRDLATQIPNFALVLIEVLIAKGKCFSLLVHALGTKSATARLAHTLLQISTSDDQTRNATHRICRLTHDQLASTIGVSRQWVSASLKEFEAEGLIKLEKKKIAIIDDDGLRQRSI